MENYAAAAVEAAAAAMEVDAILIRRQKADRIHEEYYYVAERTDHL